MNNKLYLIISLVFAGLIILGALLFSRYNPSNPSPSEPTQEQEEKAPLSNELSSGTFSLDPNQKSLMISVKGVHGETAELSWDSELQVYYLLVFDVEQFQVQSSNLLVWAISSLKGVSFPANGVVKQGDVKGFIPSGYMLGASISGFSVSPEPTTGKLTVGKKYYVQLNGLNEKGDMVTVNKEFTFTSSCVAPDCN